MKAGFPSFAADLIRPRTTRRLMAMIGMLALILLGMTVLGHSPTMEFAGPQAAVTAGHSCDHCPERTPLGGPGHCASIHGHACCMLFEAFGTAEAAVTQAWGQPHKPHFAETVIAPVPRPPASLVT